jgi:hypothetical protein
MRFSITIGAWAAVIAALAAWSPPARADDRPPEEPSVRVPAPDGTTPAEPPPAEIPPAEIPPAKTPPATTVPAPPLQVSPPLLAPATAAGAPPPTEAGLATGQVLLGTLAALGFGAGSALLFRDLGGQDLILLSVALTPAAGASLICAMGQFSRSYDGGCSASVAGAYLGATVVGATLGYLYYEETPLTGNGDADSFHWLTFVVGAAVGIVVGTGIGATIGWHLGKHRRQGDAGVAVGPSAPPLRPPAALADWPELRARTPTAAGGAVVGIPLLALRF